MLLCKICVKIRVNTRKDHVPIFLTLSIYDKNILDNYAFDNSDFNLNKSKPTCACVNKTLLFRRCANGNCIGFVSVTLHAAKLPILVI